MAFYKICRILWYFWFTFTIFLFSKSVRLKILKFFLYFLETLLYKRLRTYLEVWIQESKLCSLLQKIAANFVAKQVLTKNKQKFYPTHQSHPPPLAPLLREKTYFKIKLIVFVFRKLLHIQIQIAKLKITKQKTITVCHPLQSPSLSQRPYSLHLQPIKLAKFI